MNPERSERIEIPTLPLRDMVVYSYMVMPLFAGRERPTRCLEVAMNHNKKIVLVAQKGASTDESGVNDLLTVGTATSILQMPKLPDGIVRVLVEGPQRTRISALPDNGEHFSVKAKHLDSPVINEHKQEVLVHTVISQFEGYIKLNKEIPPEIPTSLNSIDDPARLANTIMARMPLRLTSEQSVLGMSDVNECLGYLMAMMKSEVGLLQIEKRIRNRVKKQMEKFQYEYYLNGQMRAVQKGLGEMDDAPDKDKALRRKIDVAKMPKEAKEKVEAELQELKMVPPMSAEVTVVRGYIGWMVQVPWNAHSKVKKDLRQVQEIPDTDRYDLERVKDRILEYFAVQSRVNKIKGPILCLVGPPGVGRTSLGQLTAKATGHKYVRTALDGVCDEAEIRGHRRTYVGSMPGKLIQKMAKVGVKNPLSLPDEIDKMSSDMRGDPASALPRALDPEQNMAFNDRYLEVDCGLSGVVFATTPDSMGIPVPLLNRMEVIRLSGYTGDEKLNTVKRHLLPKQIEHDALKEGELTADDSAIIGIIHHYTREARIRSLRRKIPELYHKAVRQLLLDKSLKHTEINGESLYDYLGAQRFDYDRANSENRVGQATGLVWAEMGDNLSTIEIACIPSEGELTYTGPLGEVMQEPIQAALTVVRSRADKLGTNVDFYEEHDIHVHIPEGTTLKDGSSADIAMCTALVSRLTGNPVRTDMATAGGITLRSQVLLIGGLKGELLATHRGGTRTVLIPDENKRNLEEIPDNIIAGLDIYPMERIEEVPTLALQNEPFGIQAMIARQ